MNQNNKERSVEPTRKFYLKILAQCLRRIKKNSGRISAPVFAYISYALECLYNPEYADRPYLSGHYSDKEIMDFIEYRTKFEALYLVI